MTIEELIEALRAFPPKTLVYYEGGEYKDDLRPIRKVIDFRNKPVFGTAGVLIQ